MKVNIGTIEIDDIARAGVPSSNGLASRAECRAAMAQVVAEAVSGWRRVGVAQNIDVLHSLRDKLEAERSKIDQELAALNDL